MRLLLALLSLLPLQAIASAECDVHPKAEWQQKIP